MISLEKEVKLNDFQIEWKIIRKMILKMQPNFRVSKFYLI